MARKQSNDTPLYTWVVVWQEPYDTDLKAEVCKDQEHAELAAKYHQGFGFAAWPVRLEGEGRGHGNN